MDIWQADSFQFDPLAFQQTGDINFAFQMCAFDADGFQADICAIPPIVDGADDFLQRQHRYGRR